MSLIVGRRTAALLSTRHDQPLTYLRPGISLNTRSLPAADAAAAGRARQTALNKYNAAFSLSTKIGRYLTVIATAETRSPAVTDVMWLNDAKWA